MDVQSRVVAFLFTDIEQSAALWEREPDRMRDAVACHDAIARAVVGDHRGEIVKMLGDGVYAAFEDPLHSIMAAVALQRALADAGATAGLPLKVRCGIHVGVEEHRDDDFFGRSVNRAARIMGVAYGGQVLISRAVSALVGERLPPEITLRDLGHVKLKNLSTPERVFQVLHPGLPATFPALRSLESTPNNLPLELTSFIGRENDLDEGAGLLARYRLLTIQGAGGIGKTRLSLQLARHSLDAFPDGVWLVELAPLNDANLVPQAVASALGVKEDVGRSVTDALAAHLKDRRSLIILDNCEHLVQACAELVTALLATTVDVKILASSRESLHVRGETIFALPPLAVPDPAVAATPESLETFAAARLFIERATAAQPAFRVSEANALAVARICQRLDGIPLALELAAARVRVMSVDQISSRLSDRFRLLTGGDRTALPRQRTLRAMIDWSYDLLTPTECMLFRRLAVFAGGFTVEAAEFIASGPGIEAGEVLALLVNLAEKSLVTVDSDGGRYRLLETVREYAQERLVESGADAAATRARHVQCFLALAEEAKPELIGPRQAEWLTRLDAERENMLFAHASCDGVEAAEAGLRLVSAMKHYWFNRGLLAVGYRLTAEALARAGAQQRNLVRCRALFDAGQIGSFMGRYREARPLLEECLSIARELDHRELVSGVLQPLGIALLGQGQLTAARSYLDEALELARGQDSKRELAAALNARGQLYRVEGDVAKARPLFEQMLALAREVGDREIVAIGLLNLAMTSISSGNGSAARDRLLEALAIARELGSRPAGQCVVEVCAGLAATRKEWAHAARFYGAGERMVQQTGLLRDPADDAFLAPYVAEARRALDATTFASAEAVGRSLTYEAAITEAREWLEQAR